jgi:hypothetical protein
MVIDLSTWAISDFAAWWGAIIASLMLIWNIITSLRTGARIYLKVIPNMSIYPTTEETENKKFISITAVNKGNSPTKITHFCGYYYKNIWNFLMRKRQYFIIKALEFYGNPIPFKLSPGEEWSNIVDQKELDKIPARYLFIGIMHNQQKSPITKRVII